MELAGPARLAGQPAGLARLAGLAGAVAAPAERPFAVQLRCTAGLEGGNALSGRAFRATLFFAKLFQKSASAPSPGKVHPSKKMGLLTERYFGYDSSEKQKSQNVWGTNGRSPVWELQSQSAESI